MRVPGGNGASGVRGRLRRRVAGWWPEGILALPSALTRPLLRCCVRCWALQHGRDVGLLERGCKGPQAGECAALGWAGVNWPHSGHSGAVFCIWAAVLMVLLLLSRACPEFWTLLLLPLPRQRAGWGGGRSWEGTEPRQLTPTGPRALPPHGTLCSAVGRRRQGRTFGAMVFVYPSHGYT